MIATISSMMRMNLTEKINMMTIRNMTIMEKEGNRIKFVMNIGEEDVTTMIKKIEKIVRD